MSDTYQPIYEAVRSRLSNGDIGAAIETAINAANIAHYVSCAMAQIEYAAAKVADAHATPSAVYRPALTHDGDQWCALYGENLQDGIAGFGSTPALAMSSFDKAWLTEHCAVAIRARAQEATTKEPLRVDPDCSVCPSCGGPADNGNDREYPPNSYVCSKCDLIYPRQLNRLNSV